MPPSPTHLRTACGVRQRTLRALCIFIWALWPAAFLHALDPNTAPGDYLAQVWQMDDGLPSNKVRDVLQTHDGYLWLATSQGLARFDGNRFDSFTRDNRPELQQAGFYYSLAEDAEGTLWIGGGTEIGLLSWREGHFTRFAKEEGLLCNQLRRLNLLRDGTLAIATEAGICFRRNGQFEAPNDIQKQIEGTVRCYADRADGSQYIGTELGLWRITAGKLEKLSGTLLPARTTYVCFLETPDGNFWIGCGEGLYCVQRDGKIKSYAVAEGLVNTKVQSLLRDNQDNLWIGTTGGLFRMRDGRIEEAHSPGASGLSAITSLCEDRDGSLWVGTMGGLVRLRNPVVKAIGQAQGMQTTTSYCAIETRDGAWWMGTWGGGVYRYTEKTGAVHLEPQPRTDLSQVNALCEDDDGSLWIGTNNGLFRYTDGQLVMVPYLEQDNSPSARLTQTERALRRVRSIASDHAGGLWIGTGGGLLYHGKEGNFRVVPNELMSPRMEIRSITQTRDGTVWACTHGDGLFRLKDGRWTLLKTSDGLASDNVYNVMEDATGSIWVTTKGGGLSRLKDDRWTNYTTQQGLVDNYLAGIVEGKDGTLWIGTSRGIVRIERQEFDDLDANRISSLHFQLFTKADGMPISECGAPGIPSAWKGRDGRLLFPTDDGLAVVDPSRVVNSNQPPPVHIESVQVSGRKINRFHALTIPPGHTDIQFYYTGISLLAPEKVRFKVKLEPLESEWQETDDRRNIRYSRLSYGDYVFRVIACNGNGVWNTQGDSLAFTVAPFFYQTTWFRVLFIVFSAGIIFGIYRWRVSIIHRRAKELQRQNSELEKTVAERTSELAKSYEALRASEYFYHSLVESLLQIIVRKDVDGRITYANAAYGEMLSLPLDQIIGRFEKDLYPPELAAKLREDDLRIMETRQTMEYESVVEKDDRKRFLHVKKSPLYDEQQRPLGVQVQFWDMTIFRETEEKLNQAQRELVEVSRLAGIAEVATGVLHNIGNALNSVNISSLTAIDRVRDMQLPGLAKVAQLLLEHQNRLADFFANDPRGRQVPEYLDKLSAQLESERGEVARELELLKNRIQHIKDIVQAQQSHAHVSGIIEKVSATELIEYALRIGEASLDRHGVTVTREFMPTPPLVVERQKVLQILVNLIRNAKESVDATGRTDKRIMLGIRSSREGNIQIRVTDNGVGIAEDNLISVFSFGFTTKQNGHGFGLHSSANAAREIGGSLRAESAGLGHGATFILELPAMKPDDAASGDQATPAPEK